MDRLFKSGLITTIFGMVIILIAVLTWVFSEVEAAEVVVIAGIGSGLLFIKDEHIGIKR
tara:strand:+ start:658 stop:834 length:177 start_codon:yes stop_codon:yes gene_type:complete